jgi:hypothetical protein
LPRFVFWYNQRRKEKIEGRVEMLAAQEDDGGESRGVEDLILRRQRASSPVNRML